MTRNCFEIKLEDDKIFFCELEEDHIEAHQWKLWERKDDSNRGDSFWIEKFATA